MNKLMGSLITEKASVLVQALPYIKKYTGETIVIKYGGNAMINEELKSIVMDDIVLMHLVGINVVLVHGGGPEINDMLNKIGKEIKFINGLRYTDKDTMEIVQQVLAGKVNKDLVKLLETAGGKAIGLCGLDGSLLKAEKLISDFDLGYVGEIKEVNIDIINNNIKNGYIPIISSIASGYDDEVYNINADTAAAKIASELGAKKLILMTDICGLLLDKDDESTIISAINIEEIENLKEDGVIRGGMIPKIDCCINAIQNGVKRTHIIDGRIPHSIIIELFTDEGIGTMIFDDKN